MTEAEINKKSADFWNSCEIENWDEIVEKVISYDNTEVRDKLIYDGMNLIIDIIIRDYWNYSVETFKELSL